MAGSVLTSNEKRVVSEKLLRSLGLAVPTLPSYIAATRER